jgi:hypothetical protein
MKIVIHGTKGGYHIFNSDRIPGLLDARPDFNKVAAIGQQAYAINFNSDKVIFSKYKIIRDVIGEKRIGNIAFSVLIPNNQRLPGTDVKVLLDNLSDVYITKYVAGDNLDNVREDWTFVEELTSTYEGRIQAMPEGSEVIHPGQSEAAFVYYSSEEQLESYFEAPHQEDYKPFRQIFFVKSDLEGKTENPLNALKHGSSNNLTGQIDLKNPQYKLVFNENARGGSKIEVWVNGSKCKNNSLIRKKSELEILYTKPYYEEIKLKGKWHEIDAKFVTVNDDAQTVAIREIELVPSSKSITFEVKDRKSNQIVQTEITCRNNRTKEEKKTTNSTETFKADELADIWTASAKSGNRSGKKEFSPASDPALVILTLEERKIVVFHVVDDNGAVHGYNLQIQNKSIKPYDTEIEFVGDEIDKNWTIVVSNDRYATIEIPFCPATDENPKYITLQKKQSAGKKRNYTVSAGKHGKLRGSQEYWSLKEDGSDVKDMIVPDKGYKFDKFALKGNEITAYYLRKVPFYKKVNFVIGSGVIGVLFLSFYLFYDPSHPSGTLTQHQDKVTPDSPKHNTHPQPKQPPGYVAQIERYCAGIELNNDTLENYKSQYCAMDTAAYCKLLDEAIAIRSALNKGEIEYLKAAKYSPDQKQFEDVLNNVEDKLQGKISKAMQEASISKMDMLQVARFITNLQSLVKINIASLQSVDECTEKLLQIAGWKLPDIETVSNVKTEISNKRAKLNTPRTDQNAGVTSPVSAPKSPAAPTPLVPTDKKGVLANVFWKLVHEPNTDQKHYTDLLKSLRSTNNLSPEEVDIRTYLLKICKNSDSFKPFANSPEILRKQAHTLTDLENAQKQ